MIELSAVRHWRAMAAPRNIGSSSSGPMLLLVVLFARGGIDGLLREGAADELSRSCKVERPDQALRRRASPPTIIALDVRGGRIARHDRPERRRQDHADRPAHRRARARFRHHPLRRRRHHRAADASRAARIGLARSFQITSLFPRFHRARQCRAGGAGACRPLLPLLARCARARRHCASRRARRSIASGLARSRRYRGRQHSATASSASSSSRWRSPTKPRMLLLDEPMAGMGPEESARMVELLRELEERAHDPAGRARHGRGVRARRPHLGAGLWPRHRHRRAGRRSAPTPRCAQAYLGEQEARAWLTPCSKSPASRPATAAARCCSACRCASRAGEMVTLMGRNGMGKTTTVRSIMGLTPARAGTHPLRRQGYSRPAVLPRSRKLGIGLVPEGRQIFPNLTVRENLVATAANRAGASKPWTLDSVLRAVPAAGRARRPAWATSSPAASSRCWRSAAR